MAIFYLLICTWGFITKTLRPKWVEKMLGYLKVIVLTTSEPKIPSKKPILRQCCTAVGYAVVTSTATNTRGISKNKFFNLYAKFSNRMITSGLNTDDQKLMLMIYPFSLEENEKAET